MKKYVGMMVVVAALGGCGNPVDSVSSGVAVSGVVLENMDRTVKPGDDFFNYVSGVWLAKTEIPADKARFGSFDILRDSAQADVRAIIEDVSSGKNAPGSNEQKVGDLYNSYMDMDQRNSLGITPLAPDLARIAAVKNLKDLMAYFAYGGKVGLSTPFALYIDVDAKSPTEYALHVWQTGLGLPNRDYYLKDDEKSAEIRAQYVAHIEVMLKLAALDDVALKATQIMALETKIATFHWTKEANRDADKRYNKYERGAFSDLLSNLEADMYLAASGVGKVSHIIVNQPGYLEGLNGLLARVDIETWKTYLTWSLLNSSASSLTAEFDRKNFDFYSMKLSGTKEQKPMWRRASALVSGVLGEVVGEVYVARHFKPEAKKRMVKLVDNLIDAYGSSIQALDWMGEDTKIKALDKLHKFTPKIGYPDKWKDYSALEIREGDLFGNLRRASLAEHARDIAKLGGPIQKHEWGMTPQTVNAYYNPTLNEIVFPAAILQPPFFDLGADDAINYGAIGGVIGHEIGHGFDDSGSRYNGDGKLENWWTEKDKSEFANRTKTLVAQYDAFVVLDGLHLNGTYTLGENIGDLSGISIAYKAYQKSLGQKTAPVIDGLTGDQRFFIGWAQAFNGKMRGKELRRRIQTDSHSPARFRVNGVVRNIPAFYEAFGVKEGDALYLPPEERVKIW